MIPLAFFDVIFVLVNSSGGEAGGGGGGGGGTGGPPGPPVLFRAVCFVLAMTYKVQHIGKLLIVL
jgi:hypothetical protein